MSFSIVIGIAFVSFLLAIVSLWRQTKIEEVKQVKKHLKRKKVVYYSDSSSSS